MLQDFWCSDVSATAAAVLRDCPEDARRCISIADDVLENRFIFRDHWEMERTYEPVQFGPAESDIDWAHIPGADAEWLYAMNRHTSFVNLGKAWQYTHDRRYAEKWARLMEDWIDRVPLTTESEGNTWRSLEAGLRCEYWLRSIKLVEDSGVLTEPLRRKVEACLLRHGEYLTGKWGEFQKISNWGVLQDHGLFLLGVLFNRQEWQTLALERLDQNLHRSVMDDGSQWEQSPMYHCEVLHNAADVLLIARQNGIEVPRRFEQNVHKMFRALAAWVKPNGCLPCQSDSDDADARDILAMGALMFQDDVLRTAAGSKPLEENYWDFGADCAARLAQLPEAQDACASDALPDSGNYMLRTARTPQAAYLRFHCGSMGGGHGHADQMHVDAGCLGEDFLIDTGRYTYVDCPQRLELKRPSAHNTTRVDEMDFSPCADTWAYVSQAVPVKLPFWFTPTADLVCGGHLGYAKQGVAVFRRVVWLKKLCAAVIFDEFFADEKTPHCYEQYFHFGAGSVCMEGRTVRWKGKQARAALHCLSDAQCSLSKGAYSTDYNRLEEGDVLTVRRQDKGFVSLVTVLDLAAEDALCARLVPVERTDGQPLTIPAQAVRLQRGNERTVVLERHGDMPTPVGLLCADGFSGHGRTVVFSDEMLEGIVLDW